MRDRWSYDAATGEFVRYSVTLAGGVVRARDETGDVREGVARDDGEAAERLRLWRLHETRAEAVTEALPGLEREHAEASRRLDLARAAVRSVARSVRR